MVEGYFKHAQDEKNCVKFKDGEVKIEGLAQNNVIQSKLVEMTK